MMQYYRMHLGCDKFIYDHTNSKWIDVDCIISTMTMGYNATNDAYTLDRIDAEELEEFVTKRNVQGHARGLCSCTNSYEVGVVFFSTQSNFWDKYTCNFVMHMVHVFLVVDMDVYDMQMWYDLP